MNITDQKRFTVYITPEVKEKAKAIAQTKRQSTIQYLSMILEDQVNEAFKQIQDDIQE